VVLEDIETGERVEYDTDQQRVKHLRRRCRAWIGAVSKACRSPRLLMVTLTYRPGVSWEPRHVSGFIRKVRGELGERLFGYVWVAELQQRGAVHYHVLLWVAPGARIEMPDKSGAWAWGYTQVELARTPWYVMKYTSKGHLEGEGAFPKGCRMFAVVLYDNAPVSGLARIEVKASRFPAYVADELIGGQFQSIQVLQDFWFLSQSLAGATAKFVRKRWRVVSKHRSNTGARRHQSKDGHPCRCYQCTEGGPDWWLRGRNRLGEKGAF
jgi:hypothetical protein